MKKTIIVAVLLTGCGDAREARGERDRVTCETYCDEAGGYLLEVHSAGGLSNPVCVCTFDLSDPE